MDLKDKKVLVVGTGISGIGAAALLCNQGADVILYDENEKVSEGEVAKKLPEGVTPEIITGKLTEQKKNSVNLVVISPGVPIDSPIVEEYKTMGVPVWGEIELAYNYEQGKVAAITGTNGKTTTTALVGEIVAAYADKCFVVGNIGNPYTLEVSKTDKESYTVAEISSFQLETIHNFKPVVSAILNITPDHLNRHKTMECYIKTKENIAVNQTKKEVCVLNYDDEVLREYGKECPASVVFFSRKETLEQGAYMIGKDIMYSDGMTQEKILSVDEMQLIGAHNYENVMAAIAITKALGISTEIIRKTIMSFKAVEHRIEYVATKNDVIYYNDSKGTNSDASIKAIEAMTRPTILIGGGYDKKTEFDDFIKSFGSTVKKLVLIGATREKIAATAEKYGFKNYVFADSLEEAVNICYKSAVPGDAVLLSPACASWDMFEGYEQRGRLFKEYVNNL